MLSSLQLPHPTSYNHYASPAHLRHTPPIALPPLSSLPSSPLPSSPLPPPSPSRKHTLEHEDISDSKIPHKDDSLLSPPLEMLLAPFQSAAASLVSLSMPLAPPGAAQTDDKRIALTSTSPSPASSPRRSPSSLQRSDAPHMLILSPKHDMVGCVHMTTSSQQPAQKDVHVCNGNNPDGCLLCARAVPRHFQGDGLVWSDILRIILYSLRYDAKERTLSGVFVSLKHEIYPFLLNHWDMLCKGKSTEPRMWHKQIQDALSHRTNLFESGTKTFHHYGYWRLRPEAGLDPWAIKAIPKRRSTPPNT
eukprot:TRINITY_DN1992_c0_g1_i2.p1 TRINITY_DN1992_c0_g1~~TRINITY_DN1992_c0_g1_i2.p1  ORF type:complete len:320 (-),score=28.95 TRINITY_DN1992_c0_g1_i2:85-999(-)